MFGFGTFLNALGILIGGIVGLTAARQMTGSTQTAVKLAMGVATVYVGLKTTWDAVGGSPGQVLKQLGIVILSLMLGNLTGKLLRLQKSLNHLGRLAKEKLTRAESTSTRNLSEGFVTCTVLFCVGPMAILGSVQDGLTGDFKTLALKAAMDGLATMAFVPTFGWGVMLSAIPVVAYQGTLTILARSLSPYLQDHVLLDSVSATGGLLIFCISLIILEIKRVELADYLPSLFFAPLLTWWWR